MWKIQVAPENQRQRSRDPHFSKGSGPAVHSPGVLNAMQSPRPYPDLQAEHICRVMARNLLCNICPEKHLVNKGLRLRGREMKDAGSGVGGHYT